MKKWISMLLTLAMMLTALGCTGAFAEATDQAVEPVLPGVDFGPQSAAVEQGLIDEAEKLPAKVDLRDFEGKNYVTPVKFQNPYGREVHQLVRAPSHHRGRGANRACSRVTGRRGL